MLSTSDGINPPEYNLDGQSLNVEWMCVENGYSCSYMYTNFTVQHGRHDITAISDDTFLAWTYGTSWCGGYGLSMGMSATWKKTQFQGL